ncbi:zinc-dependent metalloprotease [Alteromonas sp. 5E99-2]|uniref:zinc-dependent metalloprotease n=1 Tax=Alteromonas sp. 5E99-2 TaxID=2817683 RepID=UPI001A992F7F|nr:zinc-dependent metalloprotease [Alteromonas sp. 5E99-2]MBO1255624.1 zinc-dependent metalloprotease [Alteromonas sp. 5E99-2]
MQYFLLISLFLSVSELSASQDENRLSMVEEMETQSGLLDLHYSDKTGKVLLSIPKTGAEYIFQTSLPRGVGSNDIGLDRGQLGDTRLVEFVRYGNKVLLTQKNTGYRASAKNEAEKQSVDEAFADSVIAGFEIKSEDSDFILIDYTDYLLSDVHGIQTRLKNTEQGSFSVDKTRSAVFSKRTKSFERNTELEAVVTFKGTSPGRYVRQVTPDPISITVHLHHSFIALPDDNYVPRVFNPMSGFWEHSYYDYSAPITDNIEQQVIVRHRLKKKNPQAEVSEAVEPIVYYLDPGIPEPVLSALKEGAQWWDQAFSAAGYKNAFQVKVLPADADPMDVRYNVIQWVHRATRGWSYGTSVVDPRTGELIKGHVTLGSLRVRQDYLIALGLTSPFKKPPYDTEKQKNMALDRIRQLSAHEVGHTLGLAHNFAASEFGRASVMDYPHPKIGISDGEISLDDAYAHGIGEWDKLVIAYGYQDHGTNDDESKGVEHSLKAILNSGIAYKSDPDSRQGRHSTSDGHLWDNGADPIKEFDHLANVRKIALSTMGTNTLAVGENASSLTHKLIPIYLLHRYQLDAIAKQLGGVNYSYEEKLAEKELVGISFVSADIQTQALSRLVQASTAEFLRIPDTIVNLIPPFAYGDQASREDFASRTGRAFDPLTAAEAAAYASLNLTLHPERLNRLSLQHGYDGDIPTVQEVAEMILNTHWKSYSSDPLSARLRWVSLYSVLNAIKDKQLSPEASQMLTLSLSELDTWLDKKGGKSGYPKHEILVLKRHFDVFWKTGEWPVDYQPQPMPPGSPI